jgi:eukaryotic-like serine/threonine-protein kinase
MDALSQLKASLTDRYDIEREIGAGGMATVYLARDKRHDRPVALKLLNPELGAVLGVERFLAEIRVTANLQHPNLLPLFDSGEAEGLLFYVMPFVEGESLRARLDREKQLPVDEAVRMSVALANALDYAHSHGVIHRDLKPENILLQSGHAVIADFGIALAVSKAGGNRITQTGLSLGTPQYMSPEQATGDRVIDGRSDIYSLGAVTYEMLTGEPPHSGTTSQAIIARVLTDKPRSMRSSRPAIPEHVEAAVQHALEKIPADRFSTAHEFAEAMLGHSTPGTTAYFTAAHAGSVQQSKPTWRSRLRDPLVIGLGVVALGALGFAASRGSVQASAPRVVRFALSARDSLKPYDQYPWPAAISPDGGTLVYSVLGEAGPSFYSLRTDQLDPRPVPGTQGAFQPFFSPDGQWLGFEIGDKLRKVRLDGSAPTTITQASSANGSDWTVNDEIVIGSEGKTRGLSVVNASGGELTEIVKPDSSKGEFDYLWPIAFPDGKRFVFTIWSGTLGGTTLATVSIDGGEVSRLGLKGIRALAVIERTLVYVQADGSVMGVELNRSGKGLAGKPSSVLDPVPVIASNNGNSGIFVSPRGALVTSRGGTSSKLAWLTRGKQPTLISSEVRTFASPRLSPDNTRLSVVIGDQGRGDVWIHDFETGTMTRLSSVGAASAPAWTPGGKQLMYAGLGDTNRFAIWSQSADGGSGAEKVIDSKGLTQGVEVAPDGKSLLYSTYYNNSWEVFRVPLEGKRESIPYMTGPFNELGPRFSPDGKWVALATDESGRGEVYVRSYPNPSARIQISVAGGGQPIWSADGTRIYYRSGNTLILSASLSTSPTLRVIARDTVVTAESVGRADNASGGYDVAKDGRLLFLLTNKDDYQLIVVPDWITELRQRLRKK